MTRFPDPGAGGGSSIWGPIPTVPTDTFLKPIHNFSFMRSDFHSVFPTIRTPAAILVVVSFLVLLSTVPPSSSGQPATNFYIISGYVLDREGDPVPDAIVEITNRNTGEVDLRDSDEKGGYVYNLANLEDGWEVGHEILIRALRSVQASIIVIPAEGEDDRVNANITLPNLQILSPAQGERLKRTGGTFSLKVAYLTTMEVAHIQYFLDGVEVANTTNTTVDLPYGDFRDGTYKLHVILAVTDGPTHAMEISFRIESSDDSSASPLFLLVVASVLIIVGAAFVLYLRMTSRNTA